MIFNDRRFSNRTETDVEAVVFYDGNEYDAIMSDISNTGCKVTLPSAKPEIAAKDLIDLIAVDDYTIFHKDKLEIIRQSLRVIRVQETEKGLILGCRFKKPGTGLADYVTDKEVADYLKKNFLDKFLNKKSE